MATKGKRKDVFTQKVPIADDLTFKLPGKLIDSEGDTTDESESEESVYSGLDEEESDSAEESPSSADEFDGKVPSAAGITSVIGEPATNDVTQREYDEGDTSDEEDLRNTIGNIPLQWYDEYQHVGYNLDGVKIAKPAGGGDNIDEFLDKMTNSNYWITVKDKQTGGDVVLKEEDIKAIENIRKGKYPDGTYNPYEPWIDFFTHEKMIHPVTNQPAHKRSFIPSKWEKLQVGRYLHAMNMGWMKPKQPKDKDEEDEKKFFNIWKDDEMTELNKHHIPAPKLTLPGHEESYNPPPEYLMTEEEKKAWEETEPEDRRQGFVPQKYSCLRLVPAYDRFIKERFDRCLDLYLCPRQRKARMNVNIEDLLPKLPKPQDLQPFPSVQGLVYEGHTKLVRSLCVDPSGQWLVSGSDDDTLRFWEVSTARCMKTVSVGASVKDVAWNPNKSICLVAAAVGSDVILINPGLGDKLVITNTDNMIESLESSENKVSVTWTGCKDAEYERGLRLRITHPKEVAQVTWHAKGDYMAVVVPQTESMSVVISQLSQKASQAPFKKSKGAVQKVLFHPTRPIIFVATQRNVRVYNLLKQELVKKLMTNCKWVSSMAIHPSGDNLIVGSYDSKLAWFDMDLSTKPYQVLRLHKKAIRQVAYHRRYPLFASASDDGTVIICHGRVYNDLLQNPLIVPVKVLKGHSISNSLGVLNCQFHPTQPWIFTSGADSTIRLYT